MPMQLGIAWYFFENRQKKGGGGGFSVEEYLS